MKVLNSGRTIDGLPARTILTDDAIPAKVAEAHAAWLDAVAALKEPERVLREAEKAAQESTLRVDGERDRWRAEIRQKTRDEAAALKAAERSSKAAADALVAAIEQHRDEVRAIGARLALEAHAAAVEAALDVATERARFRAVGPVVPALPHVDTEVIVRRRATNLRESVLDELDRVNVPALVEIAGGDPCGFVEVLNTRDGARISTTPRRAEVLVGTGTRGWRYTDEEVDAK